MPQSCTVCQSDLRGIVDREYLAGTGFNAIGRLVGGALSPSSIRRHCLEHLRRKALSPSQDHLAKLPDLGDVAERWAEAIDDVERVRDDARERGDARLILQASQARADLLERFSTRFGGSTSAGASLHRGDGFRQIIGYAIQTDPDLGAVLAEAASRLDLDDLAAEIKEHAYNMAKKKNQENA